jgi:hypothetical protein
MHQSAMRDAFAVLKRVIQACRLRQVFELSELPWNGPVTLESLLGPRTQRLLSATVVDESESDLQKKLGHIDIDPQTSGYVGAIRLRASPTDDPDDPLRGAVQVLTRALSDGSPNVDTDSLKSALEWQFDAECEREPSSRFIKTLIGLEAVLAEEPKRNKRDKQAKRERTTEKLADRCAFALASTPSTRETIRRRFKEIYELRSALIHGSTRNPDRTESELLGEAEDYLARVLTKALTTLETEKLKDMVRVR